MAIDKRIAGLLYSFSYQLQDNEGNVWDINHPTPYALKITRDKRIPKTVEFEEIGSTYKILARPIEELTKEIEHDGKKFLPKDVFWTMYGGGVTESAKEYWIKEFIDNILSTPIKKLSSEMVEYIAEWHFNIDFPEGTTINLI